MLSEIDRTKTFVLIKSINEFFWSRFPWSANHFSSRIEEWKKYFLRVETWLPEILSFLRLSLSLSAAVIDKREKELNFRFSRLTKGFSFQWRISGFGKKLCQMLSRRKQ